MMLTQALIIATLIGMGLYYRRYRLPMLVGRGKRLPRQLLGLGGVLMLALAWSLMSSMVGQPGEPAGTEQGSLMAYIGMPALFLLGLAMIIAAVRASFDQVIAFLDFLTLYRRR
jgi:hypothetical protein